MTIERGSNKSLLNNFELWHICAAYKPYYHLSYGFHDGNDSKILLTLLLGACKGIGPTRFRRLNTTVDDFKRKKRVLELIDHIT
jgi:hypothetical protein